MPKVIYSMSASLDGYIVGPDGSFDWSAPDEEQHRFHNEQARELGAHLLGRRLYETMLYWETPEATQGDEVGRAFAGIWRALAKIVFSTTLSEVEGSNTRLATGSVVEEVERLRSEPGEDIGVGGATLAATLVEHDLVDEYRVFTYPVIVGGGTPYFPSDEARKDLELVETRTFSSRVLYARYRRVR